MRKQDIIIGEKYKTFFRRGRFEDEFEEIVTIRKKVNKNFYMCTFSSLLTPRGVIGLYPGSRARVTVAIHRNYIIPFTKIERLIFDIPGVS